MALRTISKEELDEIVKQHKQWLAGNEGQPANLSSADLRSADLSSADLSYADLSSANLRSANLSYADLMYAKGHSLAVAMTRIVPPEGEVTGWKQCQSGVLVKVKIPAEAKRSNAFGRKCRAEFVDVLEIVGGDVGISKHDGKTQYKVGERVHCESWCDNFTQECAGGIHFFITREEAEAY